MPEDEKHRGKHRRLANLTPPFQPGQSGNPSGRPKGPSLSTRLRLLLNQKPAGETHESWADYLCDQLVKKAVGKTMSGDVRAAALIFNRVDGLPVQPVASTEAEHQETSPQVDAALAAAIDVLDGKPVKPERKKPCRKPKRDRHSSL